jgi:hypothetical protein
LTVDSGGATELAKTKETPYNEYSFLIHQLEAANEYEHKRGMERRSGF